MTDSQIIIWERTTRLEAGIKRELFSRPQRPTIRVCRTAKQVLEKRDPAYPAVLVLDAVATSLWIAQAAQPIVAAVIRQDWSSVIAVTEDPADIRWTATGITTLLDGPIHDRQLADACTFSLSPPARNC